MTYRISIAARRYINIIFPMLLRIHIAQIYYVYNILERRKTACITIIYQRMDGASEIIKLWLLPSKTKLLIDVYVAWRTHFTHTHIKIMMRDSLPNWRWKLVPDKESIKIHCMAILLLCARVRAGECARKGWEVIDWLQRQFIWNNFMYGISFGVSSNGLPFVCFMQMT